MDICPDCLEDTIDCECDLLDGDLLEEEDEDWDDDDEGWALDFEED